MMRGICRRHRTIKRNKTWPSESPGWEVDDLNWLSNAYKFKQNNSFSLWNQHSIQILI